ncbi:MAG: hypothetical protein ACI94Y_004437 [Maribacter sp.]|jgi:hypothetical protein
MKHNIFYIIICSIFIQCSNPPKELKYVPEKDIITIENNQLSYHPKAGYKVELYTIDFSKRLKRENRKNVFPYVIHDPDKSFIPALKKVKEIQEKEFKRFLHHFNTLDRAGPAGAEFCYSPRDAFLIKNEKDEVITCIEMCFECHQIKVKSKGCYDTSDPDIPFFVDCSPSLSFEQFDYLKTYIQIQK